MARLEFQLQEDDAQVTRLIGFMSPTLRRRFSRSHLIGVSAYKATLARVAEARKLRPVFMERQPRAQRDAVILSTLTRPSMDAAAAGLIRTWLLKKYKAMLVDFLTALDIKNEEGVVENLPASMDDAKLKAAVDGLLAKYPPEVVAVYLNAFNDMNEVNWANLGTLLAETIACNAAVSRQLRPAARPLSSAGPSRSARQPAVSGCGIARARSTATPIRRRRRWFYWGNAPPSRYSPMPRLRMPR